MQLIRSRLRAATCALLAVAGTAAADTGDWHFDAGTLVYSEKGRTSVIEPLLRLRHNFANGRSLTGKIALDAITGASPNGAMPTDHPQTFTSASGRRGQSNEEEHRPRTTVVPTGQMPLRAFQDHRAALDLEYEQPVLRTLKAIAAGHFSAESDYLSRGATLTLSWDTPDHLTTFTAGASGDFDRVEPTGGKPPGLALYADSSRYGSAGKTGVDGMVGVTRVLSRRWLMEVNFGRARDSGYLTEPYKIVSIINSAGSTIDYRYENRPDARNKQDVFLNSIYQWREDVVHVSYRFFWDDWGTKSHTVDAKYRYGFGNGHYLEPHARYYVQSAVNFYTYGLRDGATLPEFATSDYRYGKLNTITIGLKYGFPLHGGDFNIRVEYMRQSGDAHPAQAVGIQKNYSLFPPISTAMIQIGYAFDH
jgi:hypothetical protein